MTKMMVNDFEKNYKMPTDDCCPIRTTSSLGGHLGIKDWDMLTKINFVKK
jgi:hypothetical protein